MTIPKPDLPYPSQTRARPPATRPLHSKFSVLSRNNTGFPFFFAFFEFESHSVAEADLARAAMPAAAAIHCPKARWNMGMERPQGAHCSGRVAGYCIRSRSPQEGRRVLFSENVPERLPIWLRCFCYTAVQGSPSVCLPLAARLHWLRGCTGCALCFIR